VVKIEGKGCGGIVEGSGYIAAQNTVVTNAHVVAGVPQPLVLDGNGSHPTKVIWFDPDLDVAVLKVGGLAGPVLTSSSAKVVNGTPAVVAGYPGGGDFTVKAASVLDQFTATGRNIYGRGVTNRDIFELKAEIIPGNSGGPLINKDGVVIGLIFAQSTTYQQVGYALQMSAVLHDLDQALARNQTVATSQCAE
jgi:S1-C subfamily serine protease